MLMYLTKNEIFGININMNVLFSEDYETLLIEAQSEMDKTHLRKFSVGFVMRVIVRCFDGHFSKSLVFGNNEGEKILTASISLADFNKILSIDLSSLIVVTVETESNGSVGAIHLSINK
jgi:hypothetical protein